jgi:isopentenyldiphosphate isomerase
MDELIDICDPENNLLNVQKMKSEAHAKGLWHRASHMFIYNSKGEVLIQLRAKDKALYPDLWDTSAAGHVDADEEPITSALREIKEEIGLSVKENDLKFFKIEKVKQIYKKILNNEFFYIYFLKFDGNIDKLRLQDEEVQSIKFIKLDELEKDLKKNTKKYVPHDKLWFEVIEHVRKKLN